MQIRLLGGFEVVIDGRPLPPADWRRRKAAALIKLLALAPGRVLHREQVIDALWPHLFVGEAAPRLHKAAHYARRGLRQPRALVLSGETVALCPDADVEVDAVRFQQLAESARDAETASAAADAYPGDLLPHDRYEAWADEPRERLRLLYLRMLRLAGRWHEQPERPLPSGRGEVVILDVPAAPSDDDWPYGAVVEALTRLRRNHPTLAVDAAPIAIVVMRPAPVAARAS